MFQCLHGAARCDGHVCPFCCACDMIEHSHDAGVCKLVLYIDTCCIWRFASKEV